ncbi:MULTISPECIES: hypothetical protein [Vibrio]|uniref:hypothetical protein n=1 Tax=Vibrio TaxID=662 RepID=UPI0020759B60|nr:MULTISPECIES: hypothetical protein [Vibrio]USD35507.1 hypothetical protein J8Z27_23085 [Vibrio sp. SCSIO 43186]USD72631.1 hypothetical protein J4N41_23090 [Vibrio sp. SCSIO 43139]USD99022.1 hypothetical protein CTT30_23400 [Vibrio coralliilyticus]
MKNQINKLANTVRVACLSVFIVMPSLAMANNDDIPDLVGVITNIDNTQVAATQAGYNTSYLFAIAFALMGLIAFVASNRNNGGDSSKTKKAAGILFLAAVFAGSIGLWIDSGTKSLTGRTSEVSQFLSDKQGPLSNN